MNFLTIFTFLIQTVVCYIYDRRVITTLKYSKYTITPSVVNGIPVGQGKFPFLVSLKEPGHKLEPGKRVWTNLCGGSIIAKEKVLTAAHCFETDQFYYAKHPEVLRVVAGNMKTNLIHTGDTETTADAQWRQIKQAFLHKDFNFPSHDIALAIVDQPWVYNKNVNYVRLATRLSDYQGYCMSAGYGATGHESNAKISPVLLMAIIQVMPRWECTLSWQMDMNRYICTPSAVSDVTRGDSGGPLVCLGTGDPEEKQDSGLLVGVVSGKNVDMTTLYTRVSEYSGWIWGDHSDRGRSQGRAYKLRVTVNVFLSIILVVLIYLFFYYLASSRSQQDTFVSVELFVDLIFYL